MRIWTKVIAVEVLAFGVFVGALSCVDLIGPRVGVPLAFILFFACGALGLFIRCPNCGKPVFIRERNGIRFSAPWPEHICSRCGTDLSAASHQKDRKNS